MPRVEARSAERDRLEVWGGGAPLHKDQGPRYHPEKILKFETQFGAFHLCERKHCRLDSGIDIVAYCFNFLVV